MYSDARHAEYCYVQNSHVIRVRDKPQLRRLTVGPLSKLSKLPEPLKSDVIECCGVLCLPCVLQAHLLHWLRSKLELHFLHSQLLNPSQFSMQPEVKGRVQKRLYTLSAYAR